MQLARDLQAFLAPGTAGVGQLLARPPLGLLPPARGLAALLPH